MSNRRTMALGIDPGFANQGIVVLEAAAGGEQPPTVAFAAVVRTKPIPNLPIYRSDLERFGALREGLAVASRAWKGAATTAHVETYTPFTAARTGRRCPKSKRPAQRGESSTAASKTGAAYGGAVFWCLDRGLEVFPVRPQQLKRRFCPNVEGATKDDVEAAISLWIPEIGGLLDRALKCERGHFADAACLAYMGLERRNLAPRFLPIEGEVDF